MSVELTLPGVTASVPAARRFVRKTLVGWGFDRQVDAAALVISELATNAVLHARSAFTVRLRLDATGALRLEVLDASQRAPRPRSYSNGSTTGRGLAIVEDLVSTWGVEGLPSGKVVWAELANVEARSDPGTRQGRRSSGQGGGRGRSVPRGPAVLAA
jgi:anti-sigma regulatory factor (Ser/Thr protein kinase)